VNEDEALEMASGFELFHDPLPSPGRLMRILGAIVEALVLSMLEVHAHAGARSAIGPQLIGDQHPRGAGLFVDKLAQ
jgi:hypothetical protein